MRHLTTRRSRPAVLALALLLFAAACGNSDDDGSAAEDTTTTASDGTEAPGTTEAGVDDGSTETSAPPEGGGDMVGMEERDTFVPIQGVPGVTDEEIRFAAIGTDSNNPLGTCVLTCFGDGIEAYFTWRNEEGGVFGRELVLAERLDDELARNLERSQEVAASNDYFGAFQATQVASGWGVLHDAGVPTWVWNIHPAEFAGRDWIWGEVPAICGDCTTRSTVYFATLTGATTIGALGYGVSENSKQCANNIVKSVEFYSQDFPELSIGYLNDDLAFGLPNGIGPEVTAMRDAGVDLIATCMDLNGMKTLGEELLRQGMEDAVLIHPNTYVQEFVAENAQLFEGDYVTVSFAPFEYDTGLEYAEKFQEYIRKLGKEPSELAMKGWIVADQAFRGILAAGPEFDRQKVKDARNSFTAETNGGLHEPIDWTKQHNPATQDDRSSDPMECMAVVQIVGGEFQPITSDETKPFLCWSGDHTTWSDPVETSFG